MASDIAPEAPEAMTTSASVGKLSAVALFWAIAARAALLPWAGG